jgi:nucleotide-binding universal stress UspA family protein
MSVKHILLPLTGDQSSSAAAVCGLNLAKQLGAHVTAGYEDELGPLYLASDINAFADGYATFYKQIERIRADRKAMARKHFDHAVAAVKLPVVSAPACQQASTMWIESSGGEDAPISVFGPMTDLVILDNPGGTGTYIAWRAIEDALFNAHRPSLIIPKDATSVDFSHVMVAWNGSREAAKATEHMVDLLPPKAKVTVLQVGKLRPGLLPAEMAVNYLGWHCIEVALCTLPDATHRTGETILNEAHRAGAGCIAMGAYTHSRVREVILGGVTDYMLRYADCPILMAH